MKKAIKIIVPLVMIIAIIASIGWYLFVYDRDFTRDMLLNQARYYSDNRNDKAASWFYGLAYEYPSQDEHIAIELANQYKADGNYTKAEYTLTNAIADGGTADLYIALCKTYVEQDKLLDGLVVNKLAQYYKESGKMFRKIVGEPLEISSSDIRRKIATGEDISDLVPPLVEAYIRRNGLYQNS